VGGSVPNGHAPKTLTEEEREKVTRSAVINSQHEFTSHSSLVSYLLQPTLSCTTPNPNYSITASSRSHLSSSRDSPLPQLTPLGPVQIQGEVSSLYTPFWTTCASTSSPRTVSGLGMSGRRRWHLVNVFRLARHPFDTRRRRFCWSDGRGNVAGSAGKWVIEWQSSRVRSLS
jgi:hypothetical protein